MICSECKHEGYIEKADLKVTGDKSPEEKTKIYKTLVFKCRNKKCINFGKEIGQEDILIYEEK